MNTRDIVAIGSQSILGAVPNAAVDLTRSMKADVYPLDDPALPIVIDGSIGEGSTFHRTFGYYGHGVDHTTATLPDGWRYRVIKVETPGTMGAVGWCLDPGDLAVSKLVAGREQDLAFVAALVRDGHVTTATVRDLLGQTATLTPRLRSLAVALLERVG